MPTPLKASATCLTPPWRQAQPSIWKRQPRMALWAVRNRSAFCGPNWIAPCMQFGSCRRHLINTEFGGRYKQDCHVGDGCVVSAHAFGGLGFDAYLTGFDSQELGHASLNLFTMRANLGLVQYQGRINICNGISC